jgi:hypothetical protein
MNFKGTRLSQFDNRLPRGADKNIDCGAAAEVVDRLPPFTEAAFKSNAYVAAALDVYPNG